MLNVKLKKKLRAYLVTSLTLVLELVWAYWLRSVFAFVKLIMTYELGTVPFCTELV